jgi:dihydrofolate reductase
VARLKKESDEDLTILGSGVLMASLMKRNLIDQYVLMIHPLVIGSGRCLFADDGTFATLKLADSLTTTTGVVIATYEPTQQTTTQGAGG